MEDIRYYQDLIVQSPKNDYFLPLYLYYVLKYVCEKPPLTTSGFSVITGDINNILKNLKSEPTNQRELMRGSIYMTVSNILGELFIGCIQSLEESDVSQRILLLSNSELEFAKTQADRCLQILPVYSSILGDWTGRMEDRYAKLFNQEKRRCLTADIFKTELRIPSEMPDWAKSANLAS